MLKACITGARFQSVGVQKNNKVRQIGFEADNLNSLDLVSLNVHAESRMRLEQPLHLRSMTPCARKVRC